MKIVFLITRSDTIGGAHVHVQDLAVACQEDGHDVTVLVGGQGPYIELLRSRGLRVETLKHLTRPIHPLRDLLALIELVRAFRLMRPDLAHVHSTKAGLVGRLAAKLVGVPVIFTAHGWAFTEGIAERSRRFALFLERMAARWSKAIICVSDYDRRLALAHGVGSEESLVRVHNGVPDVGGDLRAIGHEGTKLRIVSVARLDVPKDHALLLEALAEVREIPWELELVGDGPLTEAVREKARRLSLDERVHFSGLCNDVPERLARADMFVLVSDWEGLPLSVLEAMRAELPVVASDVGGVAEAVSDEVTGYLVPKGNRQVLAERLRTLLLDGAKRRRMGVQGRARYEKEFAFEIMYRRTMNLYHSVLDIGVGV